MKIFYLAKPSYGGWVTFTAHLVNGLGVMLYKIGNKTEAKSRDFGYGVSYKNINPLTVGNFDEKLLITAIDKNNYNNAKLFPKNSYIVIHDPTEINKESVEIIRNFNVITIRKTVQDYLMDKYNIKSKFILHPFTIPCGTPTISKDKAVSISRVDYDKNIDIILKANKLLGDKAIEIHGNKNGMCVFHKLKDLDFDKYYKGSFEKSVIGLKKVICRAKFIVDMSTISGDGGGTQYTFLEAISNGSALILNKKWVEAGDTFIDGVNCFSVSTPEELANVIKNTSDKTVKYVVSNAKNILNKHLISDWNNYLI